MNEQLQQALTEILNKTVSGIDASIGFMQAQLPDVIEQLLLWYAVKGVILFLVGLSLMAFTIAVTFKLSKKPKEKSSNMVWYWCNYEESHEVHPAVMIVGSLFVVSAIASYNLVENIMDSIQIWIAPKIWLIEYSASLVK